MEYFLEEGKVPINYNCIFREYAIYLNDIVALQGLLYCPWCGTKLPSRLGEKYFEILTQEYNISDPYDKKQAKSIPEEFKSDKWWKKRGL